MTAPEDEFTELVDAVVPRVDLVGKGANGMPFLVAKNEGGLLSDEQVRNLIGARPSSEKLTGGVHMDMFPRRDDVTLTGPPAAIAKMIAQAAERAKEAPPTPEALEATMPETVAKADEPVDADPAEIDLTEPLAPSSDVLAESMPGSSAWEQLDADSAMKWTAVLGRAKNALEVLATRERVEGESPLGDYDDNENAWDLDDACCAIDFAIGTLAAYAVGEQAEAEQMEAMTKAAAGIDPNALAVLEGYGVLVKAGRVLSAANETAIRGAVDSLQNVLNTLPAPIPDAAPVAKSEEPAVDSIETPELTADAHAAEALPPAIEVAKSDAAAVAAAASGQDLIEPEKAPKRTVAPQFLQTPAQTRAAFNAAPLAVVTKAQAFAHVTLGGKIGLAKAGDPQMVVFDADGNIVGTISPDDLSPIAAPAPPEGGEATGAETEPPAAPEAAAPDMAAAPAADATPAPAPAVDENGLLQKAVEQSTELMKSTVEEALEAALAPLRDRLDKVESQPMPGPMLKGAIPGNAGPVLRGQDGGHDQLAELVKSRATSKNPNERANLDMQIAALMVRQAPPL